MALKRRRDNTMWQVYFNFYFIVIISGLLYLILFVTSEPVCYTRISHGERNLNIKRVDCDGTEKICKRFASKKDVKVGDLLNSPCRYPETHKKNNKVTCSTTNLPTVPDGSFDCAPNTDVSMGEACALSCNSGFYAAYSNQKVCEAGTSDQEGKWSEGSFVCRAIACQKVHLPAVNAGFFNCSGYSVGDKCNLTCDDDYYPSATKYAVCEEYDDHKTNWTVGKFQCSEIKCLTNNLPTVINGSFDCAPNPDVSKGEACALICNNGFYPAYSSQAVCEEHITTQGGVWSDGGFVCHEIKCSTTNLPTVSEGSFDCAPNSNVSMDEACNLTCNKGFYPVNSSQAMCEAGIPNQGGVWSNGTFVCRFKCYDWNEWNGSEYKYISTWQTWEESRQLCAESDNSHLVTIKNKEENEFVSKIVWHCNQYRGIWIGLNDRNTEGTWEWSDGTVSTYRNWPGGYAHGGDARDCVYMDGYNGEWYDWRCTSVGGAVCERNNPLT